MSDNNQAEQTLPELPKAWGFARNVDGQIEIRIGPVCPPNRSGGLATPWAPMFGGDQMHQYARDYAAMLAAAPAASGVDTSTNEAWASRAFGDEHGGYRVCRCIDCGGDQPGHDPTCKWMNELHGEPPAASVSERARELLAQQYMGSKFAHLNAIGLCIRDGSIADDTAISFALRAIEQALTQQRGELPSAKTFASAVWRDWMTNEQADKLGAELHAWLGAHVATTPQPSADAVRELVKRWRECAKSAANGPMFDGASEYAVAGTYIACADELESLLAAASGEGVGK